MDVWGGGPSGQARRQAGSQAEEFRQAGVSGGMADGVLETRHVAERYRERVREAERERERGMYTYGRNVKETLRPMT